MSNVPVKRSQYKFTVDTPTVLAMRLDFLGLGIQKEDLTVDYISIDGIKYETEAQQENTGSWTAINGCGGNMGEILHCPGYVQYNVAASIGGKPAIEPSSATALFSLYPNPASESVTISGPEMAELRLMDSNGRVIVNRTIENSLNLNISDLK